MWAMKKIILLISLFALIISLGACADTEQIEVENGDDPNGEVDNGNNDSDHNDPNNSVDNGENDDTFDYDLSRFKTVIEYLETYHYQGVSSEALIEAATYGVFDALDDPYSAYYTEDEVTRLNNRMAESFVGIGVSVEAINNSPVIRTVFEHSPAERAGLLNGDLISHVDGEDLRGQGMIAVMLAIMGEEGTDVEIGVERPGISEILYFTMTRAEIDNPTVEYDLFMDGGKPIGYIKINSFGTETFTRFNQALLTLENDDIEGLVVDVRNNGGGYLNAVLNILNLFLVDDGNPMFSIVEFDQGIAGEPHHFYGSQTEPRDYDIVTLINDFSASASEVFASAMLEHGGYEVLGIESLGKGTMQYTYSPDILKGDEMRISRGHWLTSNGNWINQMGGDYQGVIPTTEVIPDTIFTLGSLYFEGDKTFEYDQVDLRIIKPMQIMLDTLGYGEIRQDGYFDLETQDALKAFQTAHDLTLDGTLDFETAQALNEAMFEYRSKLANDRMFLRALSVFNNE